jgi:hypothetical protein
MAAQFRGHWGWDGLRGVRKILGVWGGEGTKVVDQIKKDSLPNLDKHLGPVWSFVTINPNMVTFYVCYLQHVHILHLLGLTVHSYRFN